MTNFKKALMLGLASGTIVMALAACGGDNSTTTTAPDQSTSTTTSVATTADNKITLQWSYYAYWYPWQYAEDAGIVDKYEQQYGVEIDVVEANSYDASMDAFRSGRIDAVTVTNGDAWAIALQRESTYLIAGDYSNGNDVVLSNQCSTLSECLGDGTDFRYLDNSVSDTLLFACLDDIDVDITDLPDPINQAESDLVLSFKGGKKSTAVAWKPFVDQIVTDANPNNLCDSSDHPGLIVDGLLVGSDMPENARKALAGIWYETVRAMGTNQSPNDDVLTAVAQIPGDSLESYKSQLSTTYRLDNPADAIDFLNSDLFVDGMRTNRRWLASTGLTDAELDAIGVALPNGTVLGNANNVRLTFDTTAMGSAIE